MKEISLVSSFIPTLLITPTKTLVISANQLRVFFWNWIMVNRNHFSLRLTKCQLLLKSFVDLGQRFKNLHIYKVPFWRLSVLLIFTSYVPGALSHL